VHYPAKLKSALKGLFIAVYIFINIVIVLKQLVLRDISRD
jgi:hypothetical protein